MYIDQDKRTDKTLTRITGQKANTDLQNTTQKALTILINTYPTKNRGWDGRLKCFGMVYILLYYTRADIILISPLIVNVLIF